MSERFAAVASRAQRLDGFAQTLEPISSTGRFKVMQSIADGVVYMSQNGGAWLPISTGSGGVTLDGAYDFGGAGAGRTITVDAGAVQLNGAIAGASTILGITQTAAANNTGTITGLAIDMSAAGTAATPATVNLPALSITGAFSSIAKGVGSGLISVVSSYRNATALSVSVRNKQALAGSIVNLGWNSTNYEGVVANSILTGQTHVVTIDAQTNVTAGAIEVVGLRILVPASSSANTSAISCSLLQTAGAPFLAAFPSATVLSGSFTGFSLDLQTNVTAGAVKCNGYLVQLPNTGHVDSFGFTCASAATGGGMFQANWNVASVLTTSFIGLNLNLQSNVTAGAFQVNGIIVLVPSSSHASTSGLSITSAQTGASSDLATFTYTPGSSVGTVRGVDVVYNANATGATNGMIACRFGGVGGSTTLSTTLTGINVDMATNVASTAQAVIGLSVSTPSSSSTSTKGVVVNMFATAGFGVHVNYGSQTLSGDSYGVYVSPTSVTGGSQNYFGVTAALPVAVSTASWAGSFIWKSVPGTATGNGIVNISTNMATSSGLVTFLEIGSDQALTLGAAIQGINVDLATSITAGTQDVFGLTIQTPTSSSISSMAIRCLMKQTAGYGLAIYWPSSVTFTGTPMTGIDVNLSNGNNASTFLQRGIFVSTATGTHVDSVGVEVFSRQNAAYWFRGRYGDTGTTTATGTMIGLELDMASNALGGSQQYKGINVVLPTATAATSFAATFDYRGIAGTAAGNGIVNINTNVSGTTTGVLTFLEIGSDTATLTLGAFAHTGINVNLATNIAGNTTGIAQGIVVTMPSAVANSSFAATFDWRAALGTAAGNGIVNIEVGQATTLTGQLVGLELDLLTNVTPGAQSVSGARIQIPATTRAETNGEGALTIMSRATRQRAVENTIRHTRGEAWRLCRYDTNTTTAALLSLVNVVPGATNSLTLANTLYGMQIDLNTNVNHGGQGIIGLYIGISSTTVSEGNGLTALYIDSAALYQHSIEINHRTEASTDGVVFTHYTIGTTLSGGLVIHNTDAATNLTSGNNTIVAHQAILPAAGATGAVAHKGYSVTRSGTLGTGTNFTGSGFIVSNTPARAAGAATENGKLVSITHAPTTGGGGALTDTTTGISVTMTPFTASAVVGMSITCSANVTGAALSITHSGTAGNQNQLVFTAIVDGTGAHIYGPTAGTLVLKAGQPGGTANGRDVQITASDGSTTGTGGSVNLNAGVIAGANQNGGDITLTPSIASGAGVPGRVNFFNSSAAISGAGGAATLAATTGGATGPAVAAQNAWLVFKVANTVCYVPIWL